ncbi:sensor histidine kinase [Arenibacterium sp. LLYu02]|uniref:sensor histidine kinase n=1 Tax=Arenibacterium sp. LLYu02 TaxID=3404132 RepID=UPI003B2236CB
MRLILSQDNWKEYVRVNKEVKVISATPWSELQVKGDEPYIQRLKNVPRQQFRFSNITRNREHGTVSGPPTIRSMQSIYDDEGALAGAIVVNARVSELLAVQQATSQFSNTFYVIENVVKEGFPLDTEDHSFIVQSVDSQFNADEDGVFQLQENKLVPLSNDLGLFTSLVDLSELNPPFSIRVATKVNLSPLYAAARFEFKKSVINALLLTIFATVTGYVFASRLLKPLQDLVQDIQGRAKLFHVSNTSSDAVDEISLIGESFSNIANSLMQETQRLDMVLSNVAEGIVTLRADFTIEDLNPAAERILNLSRDDAAGLNLLEILGHDELRVALSRGEYFFKNDEQKASVELSGCLISGRVSHLQAIFTRVNAAGEGRVIGLMRDVTEQVRAAENTNTLIAALESSNAELDQFAYIASHDLKAPLRVISNAVSWLEEDLAPYLTDDTRESMSLLQSRTSRMERLLNDLLQHSRIGRVADPDIEISGQRMADDILHLLEVPDGIKIKFSDAFLSSRLNKLPLETVLVNLIGNGIKHHDKPYGCINVSLVLDGDFFKIAVEDDGPGIDPIYHERIFEVFQTLKSRDQLESSGMGLAFVKKHIEVVGGEIYVLSDGDSGTKFEFLWPREIAPRRKIA